MFEKYVFKGTEKLRCGYTTGSCATAAAKTAVYMLITGNVPEFAEIITPDGTELKLEVHNPVISDNFTSCGIVKFSGDDPDVTDGIEIRAKVSYSEITSITGGKGIGIVTKAGLDQPVGEYAINSVPRKMILQAVSEVAEDYSCGNGFLIEIYAPDGEEIAKKTYNPYMGINGGISIIGTTGIIEPMSNKALIDTIRTEMNMRKSEGIKNLLVTLGNYGDSFVKNKMSLDLSKGVKCSNFIGETIESAIEYGFESVLIVGHIGKMIKLGTGIMNTHSAQADGRIETLITCGLIADVNISLLKKLPECVTVDAGLDIISGDKNYSRTLEILMEKIDRHLQKKVKNTIKIGAVVFSEKHDMMLKTVHADEIISEMRKNK